MRGCLGLSLALLLYPLACGAQQITESVGSRALGMGGAFVGVGDDATGVYWNPAGLASGPPAGMTIEWADFRTGDQSGVPAPGPTRRTSKFVSLGSLPVGLSYGSFQSSALTAAPGGGTQAETFNLSSYGATFLQTLAPGFVLGTTVKYLRGTVISSPIDGPSARVALDDAMKLDGASTGRVDLDVGAMLDLGKARVGALVRNLREPTFGDVAETAITLRRQTRLGLALLPKRGLTLAIDVDLDAVDLRDGPRREMAVGGENRIGQRWALRGGVRWSLEGDRRAAASVGASVALRHNLWLDSHYTAGRIDADNGFGVAFRAGL